MKDVVFSSTAKLATAIRTKQVSAAEVLDAHLAQIERHNRALNAVITIQPDNARQRAREADEALARGRVWGPLQRVSLAGVVPDPRGTPRSVRIMACVGPMARTVDDLALLFSIIAGPDGRDTEVAPVPVGDVPEFQLKNVRLAFAPTFPGLPVAAD